MDRIKKSTSASFLTSVCPHCLLLHLSPLTPSSLSGGALNSVPDRPAHRGVRLWNNVCAVLSGAPSPRRSTQPAATAEPAKPLAHRPPQSGLLRKAAIDPSPGAGAHTEKKMDREWGRRERARGLKARVKGRGSGSAAAKRNKPKSQTNKQ